VHNSTTTLNRHHRCDAQLSPTHRGCEPLCLWVQNWPGLGTAGSSMGMAGQAVCSVVSRAAGQAGRRCIWHRGYVKSSPQEGYDKPTRALGFTWMWSILISKHSEFPKLACPLAHIMDPTDLRGDIVSWCIDIDCGIIQQKPGQSQRSRVMELCPEHLSSYLRSCRTALEDTPQSGTVLLVPFAEWLGKASTLFHLRDAEFLVQTEELLPRIN